MIQAVKDDAVLGYTVIGFKEGSAEGQIEELLAMRDRVDVAYALLDYGCNCLDELGVNTSITRSLRAIYIRSFSGEVVLSTHAQNPTSNPSLLKGAGKTSFYKIRCLARFTSVTLKPFRYELGELLYHEIFNSLYARTFLVLFLSIGRLKSV